VEVGGYRDLVIDQEITEVDESMIAEALEHLRDGAAELRVVDRPSQEGDVVDATLEPIDVHGRRLHGRKREEVRMEAGSPGLLREFREASVGLVPGDERLLEVHYPERFQDQELAGQVRRFRLIAKKIQEKELPALDDNFARNIDSHLDLEGLRAKIRLKLQSEELVESKHRLEEMIQERLVDANPFEIPEAMLEHSLNAIVGKAREEKRQIDESTLRERFRPIAERMHRRNIVLQNVARQESLLVSDEEMEAELESVAEDAGVDVAVLRRKMENDGEIDRFRDTLEERKTLDFLVSKAQVTRVRKPRPRPEGGDQERRIITPSEGVGQQGRIVTPSGEASGGGRIITP
jgi:trigger factor